MSRSSCSRAAPYCSTGCPGTRRATTDLDGLIRGDIDTYLDTLNEVLQRPWGACQLRGREVEVINVPNRLIKPRRFDTVVLLAGVTWRRIQVEVSPDEGSAGTVGEYVPAPSLAGFGLPTPNRLTGLAMRYQIAQKIHAASDPHDPPALENERARDAVDLLLLRDLVTAQAAAESVGLGIGLRGCGGAGEHVDQAHPRRMT